MEPTGRMGPCNLWNVKETAAWCFLPEWGWTEPSFLGRRRPSPIRINSSCIKSGFDHDPILKAEYVRDWNFRHVWVWDAMKNDRSQPRRNCPRTRSCESRRMLGTSPPRPTQQGRKFADGCVLTGWKIDLHSRPALRERV
jgi:hypothetical protein